MRRFGSKQPSKTHNRTALRTLLLMREKPLAEQDYESLARSFGVPVEQVRALAAEAKARRVG